MGFEILHQVVARPADSLGDREDKARLLFANFAALVMLGATEIALVVDSTEQSAWGFLASVNALSLVGVFGSLGLQVTLKALMPAWCLTAICFMITLWWAAAAFGIDGQGGMFATVAIATPWFTLPVGQNQQKGGRLRGWLILLVVVSVLGLIAAVVVHFFALVDVVPMSATQHWVVLAAMMALTIAAAVFTGLQLMARAAEAERIREGQEHLEERLSVAMELVREPVASLVQLASTENPPHPASVVAANLALQAVADLEAVVGFNACWASFRAVEVRPLLKTAVTTVEKYVGEVREAKAHTSSAQAVRRYRNGGGGGGSVLGDATVPSVTFALRVHDGVPNFVHTDDRRLTDVVQELVFDAAQRALHCVTVIATFQAEGTWLELRVIDDGVTLAAAQENAILKEPKNDNGDGGPSKAHGRERPEYGTGMMERKGFLRVPVSGVPRAARIVRDLLRGSLSFEKATARRLTGAAGDADVRRLHADHHHSSTDPVLHGSVHRNRGRNGQQHVPTERGNTFLVRLRLAEPKLPNAVNAGLATKQQRQAAVAAIGGAAGDQDEQHSNDGLEEEPVRRGFRSELGALSPSEVVRSAAEVTANRTEWHRSARHTHDDERPQERTADVLGRYFATRNHGDELAHSSASPDRLRPRNQNRAFNPHADPWGGEDCDESMHRAASPPALLRREAVTPSPHRAVHAGTAPASDFFEGAGMSTPNHLQARVGVRPSAAAVRRGDDNGSGSPFAVDASMSKSPPRRAQSSTSVELSPMSPRTPGASMVPKPAAQAGGNSEAWPWLSSPIAVASEQLIPGAGGHAGAWWPPPAANVAAQSRMKETDPVVYAARRDHSRLLAERLAVEDAVEPAGERSLHPTANHYRRHPAAGPSPPPQFNDASPPDHLRSSADLLYTPVPAGKPASARSPSTAAQSTSQARMRHNPIDRSHDDDGADGDVVRKQQQQQQQRFHPDPELASQPGGGGGPATPNFRESKDQRNGGNDPDPFSQGLLPPRNYRGGINGGAASVTSSEVRRGALPSSEYDRMVREATAVADPPVPPTPAPTAANIDPDGGGNGGAEVMYDRYGQPIDPDL